jgi:hypothetical protein
MWHNDKHNVFSSTNVNRVIKIDDGNACSMYVELQNQFSVLVRKF